MLKMSCPGLDMWYTPSTSTSARAGAGGAGRSRGACCETARMTAAIVVAGRLVFMQFSFVGQPAQRRDRKSTRLNSSHSQISYAVFCLKKKKNKRCEHVYVSSES